MVNKGWNGYVHPTLAQNLDFCKNAIKKDWDMPFIIDGIEGSGKSSLAQQCAKYCDDTFDMNSFDRLAFTPEQFSSRILTAEKYTAIIYDEAYTGMASRGAMSEINKYMVSILAEIRQKNLFVFMVLPCFFELDRYPAIWRSRALLHTYTDDQWQRGRFAFYNHQKKKTLYIMGKKFYSYAKPAPNFLGTFNSGWVLNPEEYHQKKLEALMGRKNLGQRQEEKNIVKERRIRLAFGKLCLTLQEEKMYTQKYISEITGYDRKEIYRLGEEYQQHIAQRNPKTQIPPLSVIESVAIITNDETPKITDIQS